MSLDNRLLSRLSGEADPGSRYSEDEASVPIFYLRAFSTESAAIPRAVELRSTGQPRGCL